MSTTKEITGWRVWLVPSGCRVRATDYCLRDRDWVQICGSRMVPFGIAEKHRDNVVREPFEKHSLKKEWNKMRAEQKNKQAEIKQKLVLAEFSIYEDAVAFARKTASEKGYGIDKYE